MPGARTAATLNAQAAITPMPISENMLRFGERNEFQPLTRNGQPHHSTTGVPSASSIHSVVRSPNTSLMPLRPRNRSEEHTSELQSLIRISYAVFCLKKKQKNI